MEQSTEQSLRGKPPHYSMSIQRVVARLAGALLVAVTSGAVHQILARADEKPIPAQAPPAQPVIPTTAPKPGEVPVPNLPKDLKTVTYDISDLISGNRPDDQPDPTPALLTADMPIGEASFTRNESRRGLASSFREMVAPKSWQPVGPASLTVENDNFVVTQTAENHRFIAKMLRQFRENPAGAKMMNAFATAPRLPKDTRLDSTELTLAIGAISKAARVPIEVNYGSFAKFNVLLDTPITVDVSGQTPSRAIRSLIRTAALRDLSLIVDASSKTITVALDPLPGDSKISWMFDIRQLPARAAGLDPKQARPREEVIDAVVDIRKSNGILIFNHSHKSQRVEIIRFLDDLDENAIRAADNP